MTWKNTAHHFRAQSSRGRVLATFRRVSDSGTHVSKIVAQSKQIRVVAQSEQSRVVALSGQS